MNRKPLRVLCGLVATAAAAFLLVSCRGSAGQNGLNGTNGTNGSNGSNGTPGASYSIDATTYSPDDWAALTLKATVTSASVSGTPVVNFKVTDGHNVPVRGLGFTTKVATNQYASYANMGFAFAKLVPGTGGSPSKWVSYIVTGNPTAAAPNVFNPGKPSTDSIGTLVDNGDGTYKYTFRRDVTQTKAQLDAFTYTGNNVKDDLGDVTYDPNLTHRLTVYVGGNARNTGTNTADGSNSGVVAAPILNPANTLIDFIPATGAVVTSANEQREITQVSTCFTCHAKFEFHGGGRQDTRYCVVCHNDQRKYGNPEAATTATGYSGSTYKVAGRAVGDFPAFVHRLHMGEELAKTGYNYANVLFNEVTYPQDQRNCVKCHTASTATPQGDNWFNKPNRMACGACHDDVNWTTGANHPGGPALSDAQCTQCHDGPTIKAYHVPVLLPNANNIYKVPGTGNNNTNASYVAAYPNNLPPGANAVTWDLKSVTLNSSAKAVVTFRFLKNGSPVVFNTYSPTGKTEMMDGFTGSPSVYIAFSVPQDGIDNPADWNATFSTYLKNIWRGDNKDMTGATLAASAQGTLTGPDGSGYYTLTFTGGVIPTTAGMVVGGIGYTYGLTATQPLTQIDLPAFPYNKDIDGTTTVARMGGLTVPAPNVWKLISGALPAGFPLNAGSTTTGPANTPRRTMVATSKCNDCHGALGLFTSKTFHAGQRNDAQTCEFCHNGQRVNSGWGVNTKDFVHAIHGAGKRVNKFSWEVSAGDKYWEITYPGVLNNCEACHVPGSYNFELSANAADLPDLNWTTVATGNIPNPVPVIITGNEPVPGTYFSPFVTAGAAYGSGFSYNANTGAITPAAGTTLVSSPYVAACSNCHDTTMALNHMKAMGGSFYVPRSSVTSPTIPGKLVNTEQCFLCHSAGKIADTQLVHMNFK